MSDNLQETLYQNIRQALLSGQYMPGERLKIRDLAAQWGSSPMPVRTALQRLVSEGALEGEQQRSVRVPLMTDERFKHILQVRLNLEGQAAELAAERLSAEQIAQLRRCVEQMEVALEGRDLSKYLHENSQFHLILYHACGNPILLRMIESLWLQVGPFFNRLFTEADLSPRLNDFHLQALQALEAGDSRGVRHAVEQDLTYFGRFLLNLLALEPA
ncbi:MULTISPECIES: GntR family transcriptional regulator [Pseudomonas]|uniref:GntR family transcriptional regulator n=1 Tax=Pseudomonas marincola TaxID=437900 RepID=A0A653E1L8_9PSED|nr:MULTISPECIES: GntR family transcriptional regulator [Pseudomonas]MBQ54880.1 GntR family transcriptional regulator [Pseudomonadaceae bacterium]OEO25852.1 GntR family transcriptional regulator [Pseudomonas sp. J237]CAE6954254.1 GntR family transcriptional regulator [Pseudomonas marincola]HCP55119.1 GntR family transcriptional regulator [Pseudomonas sp.]